MNYELLRKFWAVEEMFSGEHRTQFHNAFITALSASVEANDWNVALENAKSLVVQNLKVTAGARD